MAIPSSVKFSRLKIDGWRQFGQIDIEIHPQLTIITGANGAGKSTLLGIFSSHFGYQRPYLSTPRWDSNGKYSFYTGITSFFKKFFPKTQPNNDKVGELFYTNNQRADAIVPTNQGVQYNLQLQGQQTVLGFHVPSHRKLPNYQKVSQIPTEPLLLAQAYEQFNTEMTNFFQGGHTGYSPTYRIKEALLSMTAFGPKTEFSHGNEMLSQAFIGFKDTLRHILPDEIGFIDISIRTPDVVLVTKSGDFLIDAASGGLMALVDLAWQIYMFTFRASSFVVTIDEPENHLHPSLQRNLMGNLLRTFPQVQFIVATHSPFIVSALRDARVYVLKYEERNDVQTDAIASTPESQKRFVSSVCLNSVNKAGTANQILRDVLGMQTTYPDWVAKDLENIIKKYSERSIDESLLMEIRKELKETGYGDLFPEVVSKLVKS